VLIHAARPDHHNLYERLQWLTLLLQRSPPCINPRRRRPRPRPSRSHPPACRAGSEGQAL